MQRKFLWGSREAKAKFSLVSREGICCPKEHRGLGLRDPEIMVEVQGEKLWWKWANHSSEPWTRLWHIKYACDRPTHQLVRFNEELLGFPIWMKAVSGRGIVQEHFFWEIRDAESAKL